ncbi:MAG: hypothetical protein ACT4OZ_02340 [Gemmatimonadota bacterium]
MRFYEAFGGTLASAIDFPELAETPAPLQGRTDWTFLVDSLPATRTALAESGHDDLDAGATVDLFRHELGLRVVFSDSGSFDITNSASVISWVPNGDSNPELARLDFLGRVLAVALHERGLLSLHASAVEIDGRAIGFVAAKGSGKSTLALALLEHGARLLTDDTLPVDTARAAARPGVHSIRVWNDSRERFSGVGEARVGLAEKFTFSGLVGDALCRSQVPLDALYALAPQPAPQVDGAIVSRSALGAMSGTFMFMRHSKLGALLGGPESRIVFDRCAELAAAVPCHELAVPRDMELLPEVAATIMSWHRR